APDTARVAHEVKLHGIARTIETGADFSGGLLDDIAEFALANHLTRAIHSDNRDERTIVGNQADLVIGRLNPDKGFDRLLEGHVDGGEEFVNGANQADRLPDRHEWRIMNSLNEIRF